MTFSRIHAHVIYLAWFAMVGVASLGLWQSGAHW